MANPGAGHDRRYGSDKGHTLGQGPRHGDAGGTRGAGTRGHHEERRENHSERNHERERERNHERNHERERDRK